MKLLMKSHYRSRLLVNLLSQKSEVLLIWKLTFLFLIFSGLTRIGQSLQFFVVSFDRIQILRFILPWFLRNCITRRTWCISPMAWYQNFKATNEQNINWAKPHFILKLFALFLWQSDSHKSNTVLYLGAHPVRKNGPIKKKLYWNAIGTTEIVGKKKFKIWCHMLGYNDSQASTGRGVGEAFAVLT